ncbi:unnamed protein product [Paramecium pentaurelia]|uniref:Uncharacterized protein n=1 Tax=Paramecium pentaurelia TaxID=43138 RepID=A0A8S1UXH7_9CILI|nr:unnamed protein product [Paramecium pentaurelia]
MHKSQVSMFKKSLCQLPDQGEDIKIIKFRLLNFKKCQEEINRIQA